MNPWSTAGGDVPGQTTDRFLIVDEQPIVRDSLHQLLQALKPKCQTELAASNEQLERALVSTRVFDYVIADLQLGGNRGIELLRRIREQRADLPMIVFSAQADQQTILRCLNFGVIGFIPKTLFNDLISQALRMIFSGQVYIPRQAVSSDLPSVFDQYAVRPRLPADAHDLNLTERQTDVLGLILDGMPNKLICRRLNLAEGTVKVHVSAVLRALGVRNRTQAVIAAGKLGLRLPRPSL